MRQSAAPANLNIRVFTQSGSNSEVRARSLEVRFPLENRHGLPGLSGLKSAKGRSRPSISWQLTKMPLVVPAVDGSRGVSLRCSQ
jgi:hypothetical protein